MRLEIANTIMSSMPGDTRVRISGDGGEGKLEIAVSDGNPIISSNNPGSIYIWNGSGKKPKWVKERAVYGIQFESGKNYSFDSAGKILD